MIPHEDEGLIQRHDSRFVRIETDVRKLELDVSTLKSRVARTEEGVANFREFQRKSLNHQWYMKGVAGTILAIISVVGWTVVHGIDKILPAAEILIRYYEETHPELKGQLPKISHHKDDSGVSSYQQSDSR